MSKILKSMVLYFSVAFCLCSCTPSVPSANEDYKFYYISEEDMYRAAEYVILAVKTDVEENHFEHVVDPGDRYIGYTLSDVKIEKIIKNEPAKPVKAGEIIKVFEYSFQYTEDSKQKTGNVNYYINMCPGNKYLLYLKYTEGLEDFETVDMGYDLMGRGYGKINISDEEDIIDSDDERASAKLLEVLSAIRDQALERHKAVIEK